MLKEAGKGKDSLLFPSFFPSLSFFFWSLENGHRLLSQNTEDEYGGGEAR
jgi:hypothetical protein